MPYLHAYIGKIVRLNREIFMKLKNRAARQGQALENHFLVIAVHQNLKELICYGADFRVIVSVSDVALV